MQSFLEYVCWALLDSPACGSSWFCPFCHEQAENQEWASFSVRPPLGKYPIKWKCHRCHKWGDAIDLIMFIYKCSHTEGKVVLAELLESYRHEHGSGTPLGDRTAEQVEKAQRQTDLAQRLARALSTPAAKQPSAPNSSPNGVRGKGPRPIRRAT
jgi:hypothetical protein